MIQPRQPHSPISLNGSAGHRHAPSEAEAGLQAAQEALAPLGEVERAAVRNVIGGFEPVGVDGTYGLSSDFDLRQDKPTSELDNFNLMLACLGAEISIAKNPPQLRMKDGSDPADHGIGWEIENKQGPKAVCSYRCTLTIDPQKLMPLAAQLGVELVGRLPDHLQGEWRQLREQAPPRRTPLLESRNLNGQAHRGRI